MTTSATRLVEMLREVVAAFSKSQVAHAVAGGMAVAAHGHPRATKDIDFLIDHADAERADEALKVLGFAPASEDRSAGFLRYSRRPLPSMPQLVEWVDLLLARQPIGRRLIEQASLNPVQWQGIELPIVSAEGVVLMKLLACVADPSRGHDRGDIIALLRARGASFDRAWVQDAAASLGDRHAEEFRALTDEADAPVSPPRSTGL
jgi:ribosomal protein L12E/L44/L45/RPP1/RPP2